jgi:DNA-binding PadR family transcriptional regulator
MHPYEIQRLIRDWHKEDFLDLKRGSLYHAIRQLLNAGLIDSVETTREGRRPERTVYRLTELGAQEMRRWLGRLLAKPHRDMNYFFAGLSFLAVLQPAEAVEHLQQRAALLDAEAAALGNVLEEMIPRIGRLPLVEVQYARAMRQAESAWVGSLIDDLVNGRLWWDPGVCSGPGTTPASAGKLAAPKPLADRSTDAE